MKRSLKRLLPETGKGSVVAAAGFSLTGTFEAVARHAKGVFTTLSESFAYVAQPENLALAALINVGFGAGVAMINRYDKREANGLTHRQP